MYGNTHSERKTPLILLNVIQAVKDALGTQNNFVRDLWHPFSEMLLEALTELSIVVCTEIFLAEQAVQRMGFGIMTSSILNASFQDELLSAAR